MGYKRRKKARIYKKVQKRRRQRKRKQAVKRQARRNALVAGIQRGWDRLAGFMKKKKDQFLKSCRRCPRFWQVRQRRNLDIAEDPRQGCSHWASQTKLPEKEVTGKKDCKTAIQKHWDTFAGFLTMKKNQFATAISRGHPEIPSGQQRSETVPLTVETFTFHSLLGKGGYGKVMLATDAIHKENVAVKILKKRALIESSKRRQRKREYISTECRVLQLAHESEFLTHGYAALHTDSYLYCVMELAGGGDLFQFLKKNEFLDPYTITFIAAELVCGLQFMHSRGIIHRDLKLGNVLLTTDGHVKITDFGLAQRNAYGKTKATVLCGTPGYMAPEVLTRQPYNAAVDWFAFGVMLYLLILQKHPFPGNAAVKNIRILEREPTYSGLTDPVAKDVLSQLLCKDQSLRLGVNGNVRKHRFFSSINWKEIETGKAESPVKPHMESMDIDEKQQIPVSYGEADKKKIPAKYQRLFDDIQFVCPKWGKTYHNVPMKPDAISSVDGDVHNNN
ncbi:protein kinase C delta type-like [Pseudophryne corroboree]|uniref:protein kinase C delta type-like n=1 Tax=Pseudophryne corroboree TaxID=495146 RepID=UPI003081498D